MRKSLIVFATLAICAALAFFLWNPAAPQAEEEDDHHDHEEVVHITDEQCQALCIEKNVAVSGTLQKVVKAPSQIVIAANQIAHVIPKVEGIALTAYKNLGEHVQANEPLAALESKEMAEAKAAYLAAGKKEQLAATTYDREKKLYEKKISPTQDYFTAKNAYEEAMIDLELARQKLFALGLDQRELEQIPMAVPNRLRLYELRAPIGGSIISRHFTTGELIDTNHEVYVIADLSKVWAEIKIFSQDRPYAKQGQSVTISTHDGKKVETNITYISPIVDEETRTSLAIAEIENSSGDWLPGTFAQAELIAEEVPVALIVPKEAIQNIDGSDVIFVSTTEGFDVRPITVGQSDEKYCEVLYGLVPGESYAGKNTFLLKAELQKSEAEHMD